MADTLKVHRVFIASPGGLERERKAFRQVLRAFSETVAEGRGFLFKPIGWEEAVGGKGRPQELVNKMLRKCDFFLLILWDRWGSPPDVHGKTDYESGTEEEFGVAEECHANGSMKQIVLLFKGVDPRQLADPGPQLKKVLKFKNRIERQKEYLFKTFDRPRAFEDLLRSHLSAWLQEVESNTPATATPQLTDAVRPPVRSSAGEPKEQERSELVSEAKRLADAGHLTEAEIQFSKAIARGVDPDAFIEFGYFLDRLGRTDQAVVMFERVQELSSEDQWSARAATALGHVDRSRGDWAGAERQYRTALEIGGKICDEERMAAAYGSLGILSAIRGERDHAEEFLRKALALYEKLRNVDGMANTYGNLGNIAHDRGDMTGAEEMYRQVLALTEPLETFEGLASAYGSLGNIYYNRCDLDRAEVMYRKSLALDEQRGRVEGMATGYGNLGNIYAHRGDLERAEELHRKALAIDEKIGKVDGIARHCQNLALVLERRGNAGEAATYHVRAAELQRRLEGETPAA